MRGIRNSAGTRAAAAAVLLCATTLATAADDVVRERTTFGRPTGDITLDGRLIEAAWRAARPQIHFFEIYPANLGRPAVETTAAFLYDDRHVYVAVRALIHTPQVFVRRSCGATRYWRTRTTSRSSSIR